MSVYKVSATQYFSHLPESVRFSDVATFTATQQNIDAYKDSMEKLIDRYNIRNKSILSLACGTAFEKNGFMKVETN